MAGTAARTPRGKPVHAETRRFLVRSLTPRDAAGTFRIWVANAALMSALNMPGRRFTQGELENFINSYDDRLRILVGIFERQQMGMIGAFMLEVNPVHALLKVSGFLGDRNWWGKNVLEEVGTALFDDFFTNRGIEKATAQVWEKNFAILAPMRRLGFQVEGYLRNEIKSFDGSGRRSQFILGLLASDWKPYTNGS